MTDAPQPRPGGPPAGGLHDRPVLVLDPGMHTAMITAVDLDPAGGFAVSAANDKTLRLWALADGAPLRTLRLPAGPGAIGSAYVVAVGGDGATIAAGGWTRCSEADPEEQVYLFDPASGAMTGRIAGLPSGVTALAFAPDGRLAALHGSGLRVFAPDGAGRWRAVAEDAYADQGYGLAFGADGRLVTSCYDGHLRFYDPDGRLEHWLVFPGRPGRIALNPADGRLAVGCDDARRLLVYHGRRLTAAPPVPAREAGGPHHNLPVVAWSADGGSLYAAGRYEAGSGAAIYAWDDLAAPPRGLPAGRHTVLGLRPLPGGGLLVGGADPWLGAIAPDGTPRWRHAPPQIDAREVALSAEGRLAEIGARAGDRPRLRFDAGRPGLAPAAADGALRPAVTDTLPVTGWADDTAPALAGTPLALDPLEIARCLAIAPDAGRFLLGADWAVRCFDAAGAPLWKRPVAGPAWAVNVAGDGRVGVAACHDGTLRWYRMDDGAELLALFAMPDGENWVAWTPEGVYAATPAARAVLRWHVNHGWDAAGEAVPASAIPETFRPDVIPHVLPQLGTPGALAVAELARIRSAVQRATGSDVAPGARLHVLAIGVSDHGAAARHLDLAFASQDARDVAAALRSSQGGLYARVLVSELLDAAATKQAIFAELAAIRDQMARGTGDVALLLFSGHGALVDGRFYLLPHGVSAASPAALKATALAATDFHDEIAAIARHGRVLLLIDACRSGAAVAPLDRSLRALLDAPNTTVFTASTAGQTSVERADWRNGAFTEALLEAFAADADRDGLIRISDLSRHLSDRVPALTGGAQHPEVDIRFDTRILAATA